MKTLLLLIILTMTGCIGSPEGVISVKQFEVNRYLGKWYEIARLDHRFERGLTGITAEYSLKDDGALKVINSGYDVDTGELEQAEGKAYFTGASDVGRLKVSFFGPFYGGYHIIALDKQAYQYAMVAGPDRDYLWILARTPNLEPVILDELIARAKAFGFAVDKLIYTGHSQAQGQ